MTPAPRHLLAAGMLAAAVLLTADTADASYSVAIKNRTLTITGHGAGDRLALRARPRKLEIDVGDNGTADSWRDAAASTGSACAPAPATTWHASPAAPEPPRSPACPRR